MKKLAFAALAACAALIAVPALAQAARCMPLEAGLKSLSKQWGETIVWSGKVGNEMLYLTQSSQRHTWTLLAVKFTLHGAEGCIVQAGTAGSLVGHPATNGSIAFYVARGPAKIVAP